VHRICPHPFRPVLRQPVSTKIISDNYTGAGFPKKNLKVAAAEEEQIAVSRTRSAINSFFRFVHPRPPLALRNPQTPQRSDSSDGSEAKLSVFPNAGDSNVEDAKLQVSVLIAMPNPYHPHGDVSLKGKERRYGADDDEELPEVMFGVAELPWKVQSINTG
jgi:hypothetical protein